jgi:peroxiredoxin
MAPDFDLFGSDGTEIERYCLSDALSDGHTVVLSSYLFDFHPGCTAQVCAIRNSEWFEFMDDVTVFGLSADRPFSHKRFAAENDLNFAVLSDPHGEVAEAYGVCYDEFNGHTRLWKRAIFVVAGSQTIRYAWATDDPSQTPELTPVKETIETIQSLPANGESTATDEENRSLSVLPNQLVQRHDRRG